MQMYSDINRVEYKAKKLIVFLICLVTTMLVLVEIFLQHSQRGMLILQATSLMTEDLIEVQAGANNFLFQELKVLRSRSLCLFIYH